MSIVRIIMFTSGLLLSMTANATLMNVALDGAATQSTTAHGGVAGRAIDGNTSGVYGDGSVTHTYGCCGGTGSENPWWMVDLGSEFLIDHVVLFSGDGDFRRLIEAVQRKGVRVTVVSTVKSSPPETLSLRLAHDLSFPRLKVLKTLII